MDRAEPTAESECGVNVVFDVVGSKWKPTILWRLAEGDHRFAQLRRAVGEVSEKVLASQLRELERDGLVVRTAHDGFPSGSTTASARQVWSSTTRSMPSPNGAIATLTPSLPVAGPASAPTARLSRRHPQEGRLRCHAGPRARSGA